MSVDSRNDRSTSNDVIAGVRFLIKKKNNKHRVEHVSGHCQQYRSHHIKNRVDKNRADDMENRKQNGNNHVNWPSVEIRIDAPRTRNRLWHRRWCIDSSSIRLRWRSLCAHSQAPPLQYTCESMSLTCHAVDFSLALPLPSMPRLLWLLWWF